MPVSVQFIDGLNEELSEISLRKRQGSSAKIVVFKFDRVQAMEKGRSFVSKIDSMMLRDDEGEIKVYPNGIKFMFVDDDNLSKAECSFEVDSDDAWNRVMRFMNRYGEAYGFEFKGN